MNARSNRTIDVEYEDDMITTSAHSCAHHWGIIITMVTEEVGVQDLAGSAIAYCLVAMVMQVLYRIFFIPDLFIFICS